MIPARPDTDCATSERSVFERFAVGLPASWTVLHGRKLVLPATPKMPTQTCEIDFLVLDPARGLLALEVKGGGVQRESDDLWYSIDAAGTPHQIHNPQKQVTKNVYALRDWLREQPPFDSTFLPIGWGVVFTDITVDGDLGPDLPRQFIVDRHDLGDVTKSISRVFEANSAGREIRTDAGQLLDAARQRQLIDLLALTVRVVPLLGDRIDAAEAQLVRMTGEQNHIFDFPAGRRTPATVSYDSHLTRSTYCRGVRH